MPKNKRGGKRADSITDISYEGEFIEIAQSGEVKIIKYNGDAVTAPMETRTRGRVYATLNKNNDIKHITFYDLETGERIKQIDVFGRTHKNMIPHVHLGYTHDEYGTRLPNKKENEKIQSILNFWKNKRKKLNM